jgi:hypothetical protein
MTMIMMMRHNAIRRTTAAAIGRTSCTTTGTRTTTAASAVFLRGVGRPTNMRAVGTQAHTLLDHLLSPKRLSSRLFPVGGDNDDLEGNDDDDGA